MKGHYSDVIGCKIHLQKLIAFLITRSKSWKFNLNIPFTIVAISKIKKKILRINLTKAIQDVYGKNLQTLTKISKIKKGDIFSVYGWEYSMLKCRFIPT